LAQLSDGFRVELSPGTVMALETNEPTLVKMALNEGRALFEVTRTPGRGFVVFVDDVQVEVVGTRFVVAKYALYPAHFCSPRPHVRMGMQSQINKLF
jgi:ferric-dicitrate binding protein FerR (iron transport regulator)